MTVRRLAKRAGLAAAAPHARWVGVFCEPHSPHAFTADEARAVLLAGREVGLGLRVHGNQLGLGPGVQLAVELGAVSVDHATYLSAVDVDALVDAREQTVATLLPGVEFSTRSPYPDGAALLRAGATVALATDCNPGTCYSSSMPFVIALAVRELDLTPGQAVYAATADGAAALRRSDIGRIEVGGYANFALLNAPSLRPSELPSGLEFSPGRSTPRTVLCATTHSELARRTLGDLEITADVRYYPDPWSVVRRSENYCGASSRAVAAPIPDPPPVTIAERSITS